MDAAVLGGVGSIVLGAFLPMMGFPKPVAAAGAAVGAALVVYGILPTSMRPILPQLALYALGSALIAGAFAWQVTSATAGSSPSAEPPKPVPPSSGHDPVRPPNDPTPSGSPKGNAAIGLDISGDHQGGGAMTIDSQGSVGSPSVGARVVVHPQPGQSAMGVRVIQTGPGAGLVVRQNGPGIGLDVHVSPAQSDTNKPN